MIGNPGSRYYKLYAQTTIKNNRSAGKYWETYAYFHILWTKGRTK